MEHEKYDSAKSYVIYDQEATTTFSALQMATLLMNINKEHRPLFGIYMRTLSFSASYGAIIILSHCGRDVSHQGVLWTPTMTISRSTKYEHNQWCHHPPHTVIEVCVLSRSIY